MSIQLNKQNENELSSQYNQYYITIIIPCYNCEHTIKRAVDSVINQSFGFDNIELILYDDFSSDTTRLIIEEYSKSYENIIPIFSNKNSGYPGKGRNEGIKKATSDFIMFMDNDDEYDENICKKLFNEITSENCDLVTCNYLDIDSISQHEVKHKYYFGEEIKDKVVFYDEDTIYLLCRLVWSCIFRKEKIINNNILFPEDKLSEDVYFLSIYNIYANKIIYLKEYIGIYRHIQKDSHSNSLTIDKINNQLDVFDTILKIYINTNSNLSLIFESLIAIIIYNLYHSHSIKEPKHKLYSIFERIEKFDKKIKLTHLDDSILNIANKLILNRHFYFAKKYLIFLSFIEKFDFFINIYRFFKP